MAKNVWCGVCLVAAIGAPSIASAGWIVEWVNTPFRQDQRQDKQVVTSYIDGNKTRVEQPQITTVYDYDGGRFTVLNQKSKFFWSGSVDDYVNQTVKQRNEAMQKRYGGGTQDPSEIPEIDPETLPEIAVLLAEEQKEIAGHATTKYVILVDEQLFQEIWIATDLDLSDDLDPKLLVKYQQRSSRGMIGKSSAPYNALYRSQAYLDLLQKGYALQTVTHHIAGRFEQLATSIRESGIEASRFAPPDDYRKVRLNDVFRTEAGDR